MSSSINRSRNSHMERSQGFVTSMFRALTGSRCKTRRQQVTWIPPRPVTIGSHTPATLSDAQTSKALAEDVTQDEFVARQLATVEEEPLEEPSKTIWWENPMWQRFNKEVNTFPYFVLMWRRMSTSQITLMNNEMQKY